MSGPWLPEPLVGQALPPPERGSGAGLRSLGRFPGLLERLAPEERAAFLLHEVFDCDYPEIAQILGKNEASCRQIVHRARERVRRDRPRFQVSEAARTRLLENFVAALHSRTIKAAGPVRRGRHLDLGRRRQGQGGAQGGAMAPNTSCASRPASGGGTLSRLTHHVVSINGEPGLLMCVDGRPVSVISIDTDGVRILAVYTVLNPDKLKGVAPSQSCGERSALSQGRRSRSSW